MPGLIVALCALLKTLHGDDPEEAEFMRKWASGQGWFDRAVKVEKML